MKKSITNPFGSKITTTDIIDTMSFFEDWEDRYKYIIDLGKQLPHMDEKLKIEKNIVRGCQSQVWLVTKIKKDHLYFQVCSDAFIVSGLLGIIMAAYNGKTPLEILSFDMDHFFDELDLFQHLSSTRGTGLNSMVQKIQALAQLH